MRRLGNSSQKGAVLVFVALLLPMLVFFGGMAIDFGRAYLYKSDLQNAADAAALAGVVAASQSSKARLIDDAPANKTTPADVAVIKSRAVSASNVTLVKDIGRAGASNANTKLFTDPQNEEDEEQQNNTYYYMVELTDEVKMVFARLFLPDSLLPDGWNIKVVARAWAKAGDGGNDGNDGVDLLTQLQEMVGLEMSSTFNEWWKKDVKGTFEEAQTLSYTNTGVKIGTDGSRSELFRVICTLGR
ncbi:MAG: Tad domain-containing protein [Selenomonas sp.]|nr:Tad domain-containing protein [Selenomonas sp.]